MASKAKTASGQHTVAIEGELTIYRALEIKSVLLELMGKYPEVEVNLAGVSEIDSAGLQLLVAAKWEAALHQTSLRFTGHSPAVLEIFDLCGLTGFFGDPVVIQSAA